MKIINLNKRQPQRELTAIVDDEDYERVNKLAWTLYTGASGVSYAKHTFRDNSSVYLHRFILNAPNNKIIDHKNHNGLDNRKENIRFCSYSENSMNSRKPYDNTSTKKGVYWNKDKRLWQSQIVVNGKCLYLGRFYDLNEAHKARIEAESKYFPNFL